MEKKNHIRINKTILGPLERPALNWLVENLPAWVTPDHLTGLGLFASFLIFISYWATNFSMNFLWLASFGFFLNWFGDSLDGTLARKRKIERPLYGFFIDHIIDAISTFLIFLGLGFSPYLNMELALIALIGYLLLSIYTYLSTYTNNVFQISFGGLGPTEIRVLAIILNMVIYFIRDPQAKFYIGNITPLTFLDIAVMVVALILYTIFLIISFSSARSLRKIENERLTNKPSYQNDNDNLKRNDDICQ